MKMYTEDQLKKLLKEQRENCANEYFNRINTSINEAYEWIKMAEEPDFPAGAKCVPTEKIKDLLKRMKEIGDVAPARYIEMSLFQKITTDE